MLCFTFNHKKTMAKKRKRMVSNGVLVAWSNGERTHVGREQLKALERDYDKRRGEYLQRLYEGREWETDEAAVLRGESMLMEEYSDRLWELDRHVESLNRLIEAALHLIDWNHVVIGCETNYYHRNLSRFRYVMERCRERVRQMPELKPLLENSSAHEWLIEMESTYADCKGSGWAL